MLDLNLVLFEIGAGMVGNWQQVHSRYDIGDEIGSGGFGRVFAATRLLDEAPVAIKDIAKWKVTTWEKVGSQLFNHLFSLKFSTCVYRWMAARYHSRSSYYLKPAN